MTYATTRKSLDRLITDMQFLVGLGNKYLFSENRIDAKAEREVFAESLLLRACARWGLFCEDHFIACVAKAPAKLAEERKVDLPETISRSECRELLLKGSYLRTGSTKDLVCESKKYLPPARNPFLRLEGKISTERIDHAHTVRNYLAHYSHRSRNNLTKMYHDEYGLQRFREPGAFLCAKHNRSPRLLLFLRAFLSASNVLATAHRRIHETGSPLDEPAHRRRK